MNNQEVFYCKKCGKPAPFLKGGLDSKEQEYKYCVDCGTAYSYTPINLNKMTGSPLYKKICELHNLYFGEENEQYYNLSSNGSAQVMYRLANYFLPDILKKDFVGDEKRKQQIVNCATPLAHLYWNLILDGYFAWIAEQLLSSKKIDVSKASNSEGFENECHKTAGAVYDDFVLCLKSSQDSNSISRDTAFVLQTFVLLQGRSYFNSIDQLRPLEDIYFHIQATCLESVVYGYAVGIAEARYRK